MKIVVRAKSGARATFVERITQATLGFEGLTDELDIYKVSVKEPPVDGKANEAIIKALAKYFDVSPSSVRLVSGHTAKRKIFDITVAEE